ncbi:HlyD family efflux transporter periplasmic adaptor subunit [Patescibacteria group bacterium]|nr:HlyD family efflux transporter periplasmic adaptor subunit [Patescibacteria group bacterium]
MLKKLVAFYKRNRFVTRMAAAVLLTALVAFVFLRDDAAPEETIVSVPNVTVSTVRNLAGSDDFSAVGTVSAMSEARLQAESAGRVTAVTAQIGNTVRAGQVIATIENASERASLLQAEGAYEAAVAGAVQGNSGSRDAASALKNSKDAAVAVVRDAYTDSNTALITSIDQFFSEPDGFVPGLRIDGNASVLNAERVAFQPLMTTWKTSVDGATPDNVTAKLDEAERNVIRTIAFVDSFAAITRDSQGNKFLAGVPVTSLAPALLAKSSELNGTLRSIQSARAALTSAEEAALRSEIAGSGGSVSLADAQVKIALGSLRAAQAAYEKTLVRTPITGVVNALYLKTGEYVSPAQPAAIVANNNGLEIRTDVNESDAAALAVGDVVTIDETASGTITAIGGAIDPTTGRVAVKVSVDDAASLSNGSTVSLTFSKKSASAESNVISIPLSAIKMTGSGPVVFTVNDERKLTLGSVTLGAISGERVIVETGLTMDSVIVVDARGLKEGEEVNVVTN